MHNEGGLVYHSLIPHTRTMKFIENADETRRETIHKCLKVICETFYSKFFCLFVCYKIGQIETTRYTRQKLLNEIFISFINWTCLGVS